jgi:hypothetical protein
LHRRKFALAAAVALAGAPLIARAGTDDGAVATAPDQIAPLATAVPPSGAPPPGGAFPARLMAYYADEMGKTGPARDPNAPSSRRADFPPSPAPQPPYPFTEWPYGAATSLGVSRPNSVDSPLMAALAPTGLGKALGDAHIQIYGWVDVGGNVSTNHVEGGNAPAAYDYNPNRIQLDQAVIYAERVPDTVQQDHIDWGFRVSAIYGADYRYTTSYGLASYQLLKDNKSNGYDFPMLYGEIFIPRVMQGLLIRIGRYISIPDIEAQLAPNNYMYSHSITYTFDNYTNTGVVATLAVTRTLFIQAGVVDGTETALGNLGQRLVNLDPNPIYPHATFRKDPGAQPSFVGCIRYQSSNSRDDLYVCVDGLNSGVWGYNNLQWYGFTYYHKFTDKFHVAFETYNLHESKVPNASNTVAAAVFANGGTPFSPQYIPYNAPGLAQCKNVNTLTCTATAQGVVAYWNYQFLPLDNLSLRTEYFNDPQGQRTGVATSYEDLALGVQHWLSPQIEFRPEIAWYRANDAKAFDGNSDHGVPPNRQQAVILSADAILHF